jgi:long-subunit fatty acid transport protein
MKTSKNLKLWVLPISLIIFQAVHLHAQEGFKMGIQAGLPFNDFNEPISMVVGADVSYMYPLGEVVDIGPSVGYIHGFAETFQSNIVRADLESIQFVPLSAGVRIWTSNDFSFGGNAGWALGINEGNDGGLYYRPMIAYLMSSSVEVNFSYTAIELEEATWSTLTLGIVYNFEPKYRTRR